MSRHTTLASRVNGLPWHHQIDFGDGIVSPGKVPITTLLAQADIYFKDGITSRSFLDIGCWDGFNSFEAARRGALRVVATDHFAWSDQCWGDRASFELARAHLAPTVEVIDIDLPDLTAERVGIFDMVLFAGVFYHLRHPFLVLEKIAPLASSILIVETLLDAREDCRPMMVFYPGAERLNDPTNWWGPNRACVEAMLRDVGFPRVEFTEHPVYPDRGIFHAYRRGASAVAETPIAAKEYIRFRPWHLLRRMRRARRPSLIRTALSMGLSRSGRAGLRPLFSTKGAKTLSLHPGEELEEHALSETEEVV